jgi:hypothetical protein
MRGMVLDPGQPLEDRGDPGQRPEIGRKPMPQRPLAKSRIQLGQLLRIQRGLAPQTAGRLQPRLAARLPGMEPPMRRDRGHPQGPRDRRLGLPPRKPSRRLEATRFQRRDLASSGHASTWHRT